MKRITSYRIGSSCHLLIGMMLFLPALMHGQTIRPERVFKEASVARHGFTSATIPIPKSDQREIYLFDSASGRFVGFVRVTKQTADTISAKVLNMGQIVEIVEKNSSNTLRTTIMYDSSGNPVIKHKMVADTLFSVVYLVYNLQGLQDSTFEVSSSGDTISWAKYNYDAGGRLILIEYRGFEISKIEYKKRRNQLTSRVFASDQTLRMTRTEVFRRDRLIRKETLSIAGIRAIATTKYRYRGGLLRSILHPDGQRSKVQYQ